jgi:hypothetical protein
MSTDQISAEPTVEVDRFSAGAPQFLQPASVRRTRWIAVAIALVVVAGAIGFFTENEVQANTQFDQTHHSLDVTQRHLDTVLAELASAERNLAVVKSGVVADSAALAKDTSELRGVEKALLSAQANVSHQNSTIGDLTTCLGGVEQALNALAVADQGRAIGALQAVATSCSQAVASDA